MARRPTWTSARCSALAVALAAAAASSAFAAASEGAGDPAAPGLWLSLGALAGTTRPDPGLADYQWDVVPRTAWGAQGLAGTGRYAAGLRLWRHRSEQNMEAAGVASPTVRMTSLELIGRGRLATRWGTDLHASAGVGRLRLGYDPDRVEVPSGSGAPIVVDLAPMNEWIYGGGLALSRPVAARSRLGLEIDHRRFGMDVAYRHGDTIENRRESFGEWSARLELAWVHPLR